MKKNFFVFGSVFVSFLLGSFLLANAVWAVEPQIAGGQAHTVALNSDGTLWAWGYNPYGQLGDNTTLQRNVPVLVSGGANNWVAVAAGRLHTVALKSDGTLWAWGYNAYGQLGDATNTNSKIPVLVSGGANNWVAVAAGDDHTVALRSDGTLWAWGYNFFGQLGDNSTTNRNAPVQVFGGGTNWVSIAGGGNFTVALKSDGTLWAWGINDRGQLGDNTTSQRSTPVQVSGGGNNWVAIAAGFAHTVALKSDGTLWTWGLNFYGQLGDGTNADKHAPVQTSGAGNTWVKVAAGHDHTVAMKSDGTLWAWGYNFYGQLGDSSNSNRNSPGEVSGGQTNWVAVSAGDAHTLALKSDGTMWAWGYNQNGQLGDNTSTHRNAPVSVAQVSTTWVAVAGAGYHTAGLKSNGTLWGWGRNEEGQLGDGTNTDRHTPVQVSGGGNTWVAVAAGFYHTLGLQSDGTLYAWGQNLYGQLGDGTNTSTNTPLQVFGKNTWVAISAGGLFSVALRQDGTLWAWGSNIYGQLGDNSTTNKSAPVQVFGGGSNWVAIAAGSGHTVALKSDGTLWAWGQNDSGQLGDGSTTNSKTPVQVSGGGNTWVKIAAGAYHTVAMKSDGTLWAWGGNPWGQIGNGTNTNTSVPVQVAGGLNTWTKIAAEFGHTVALKSDGTLWAWGWNANGHVGDGSTTDRNAPVQVSGGGDTWVTIESGFNHTIALKSDGSLWAWGYNNYGQLGDGTSIERHSPARAGIRKLLVDFDGDGIADIGLYRSGTGAWFYLPSSGGAASGAGFGGDPSDIPAPGDYDGDGKTDYAVYRLGTGAWFIYPSKTLVAYGVGFGGNISDKPVPGDYDGDGITDVAIYRTNTGAWFIYPSSTGAAGVFGVGFGGDASDKPVPADYDGDGITDLAIYRAATGAWFIYPSSTGAAGIYGVGFGGDATDKPVPGHYDGDTKADLAIYRSGAGSWFIYPSTIGAAGIYGVGFGGDPSDRPAIANPGSYM